VFSEKLLSSPASPPCLYYGLPKTEGVIYGKNAVHVSPAFNIVSWVALMGGVASYLVGLWNAEMQLNERGYYFAVLLLGLLPQPPIKKRSETATKAFPPRRFITLCA
jgi:uncharacterized membrane protein YiaA